jgi:hypothetical protein
MAERYVVMGPTRHPTNQAHAFTRTVFDLGLRDQRRELVGALTPAFLEPHLFVRFPIGNRPMPDQGRVSRLATYHLEREDDRHERLV